MEKCYFVEINELVHGFSIEESENSLTVFLTNFLSDFWKGELDKNDLPAKSKEANSLISISDRDVIIQQILGKGEVYSILESTTDSLKINVKYLIQNYPYNFHWHLKKCSPEAFQMYFTNPLLRILVSQRLQINHLTAAVIAKDVEIQQYKLNGATLVREQLATQEFNEQQFNEKYAVKDVEGFGKMLLTESACDNLKVALKIKDTTEKVSAVGKASSSIIKLPSKPKNKVNRPKDRKIMNHQQKDIKLRYESSEELIDMSAIPVNVEQVTQSISSISTPAKKKPKLFNRPLDI